MTRTLSQKHVNAVVDSAIFTIEHKIVSYLTGHKNRIPYDINTGVFTGSFKPKNHVITVCPGYEFPRLKIYFSTREIYYYVSAPYAFLYHIQRNVFLIFIGMLAVMLF